MNDSTQNGNGAQTQEEFRIPDFLVSLVGRQQVQIAALEAQLQMFQMQQSQPAQASATVAPATIASETPAPANNIV